MRRKKVKPLIGEATAKLARVSFLYNVFWRLALYDYFIRRVMCIFLVVVQKTACAWGII